MNSWQPHGLIQKRGLEEPYQQARRSIDASGNEKDPKEHYTVHLFEDLFNKQLFQGDDFYVNSQQPPLMRKGRDKACDIVIKYLETKTSAIKSFVSPKRRGLEIQSIPRYEILRIRPKVIARTSLRHARITAWCFDKLVGFWDGNQMGDFRYYKDVGLDEHRAELENAFDMMKSVPPLEVRLRQDISNIGGRTGLSSTSDPSYPQFPVGYTGHTGNPQSSAALGYPTAGSSTTSHDLRDTVFSETATTPARRTDVEQHVLPSHVPQLLDENYVSVSIREFGRDNSENIYRFTHENGTIEKKGSEWHQETVLRDGQWISCRVCVGKNSGIQYWTWTLDPDSESVMVDVKDKTKGKRRR